MIDLLPVHALPPEFGYPAAFVRVVELRLIELEPWQILGGDQLGRRTTRTGARRWAPPARWAAAALLGPPAGAVRSAAGR